MKLDFQPLERDLILRYGYPSAAIAAALKAGIPISCSRFDLERLAGELSRSINHGEVPDEWLDHVDGLCEYFEQDLRMARD